MKELKKLKLNQIVSSEIEKKELKKILGGACKDYSCDCSNPNLESGYVNGYLDASSTYGYIP